MMKIKMSIWKGLLLAILIAIFLFISCKEEEGQKYHDSIKVEGRLMIDCDLPYANRKVSLFRNKKEDGVLQNNGYAEKEQLSTLTNSNGEFVFSEVTEDIGIINSIRWWTDTVPIVDKGLVNINLNFDIEANPDRDINIGTMHTMQGTGDIDLNVSIFYQIESGTHCQLTFKNAAARTVDFIADGSYPIVVQVDDLGWNAIDCSEEFPCRYMLEGSFSADTVPHTEKDFLIELSSPCPESVVEFKLE